MTNYRFVTSNVPAYNGTGNATSNYVNMLISANPITTLMVNYYVVAGTITGLVFPSGTQSGTNTITSSDSRHLATRSLSNFITYDTSISSGSTYYANIVDLQCSNSVISAPGTTTANETYGFTVATIPTPTQITVSDLYKFSSIAVDAYYVLNFIGNAFTDTRNTTFVMEQTSGTTDNNCDMLISTSNFSSYEGTAWVGKSRLTTELTIPTCNFTNTNNGGNESYTYGYLTNGSNVNMMVINSSRNTSQGTPSAASNVYIYSYVTIPVTSITSNFLYPTDSGSYSLNSLATAGDGFASYYSFSNSLSGSQDITFEYDEVTGKNSNLYMFITSNQPRTCDARGVYNTWASNSYSSTFDVSTIYSSFYNYMGFPTVSQPALNRRSITIPSGTRYYITIICKADSTAYTFTASTIISVSLNSTYTNTLSKVFDTIYYRFTAP